MRLAFVGQSTFFEACALGDGVVAGLSTTFVEHRKDGDAGAMRDALEAFDPDVVLAFRPEVVPPGSFAGLRATTVGFLTEPLPRVGAEHVVVRNEDLERRLWELGQVDAANFDRVVAFDPHIVGAAGGHVEVWRSLPLPVADRYYAPVAPLRRGARALFVGRSTPHREALLAGAKHAHDVVHYGFGVDADLLGELLGAHQLAINLHNEPYLSFENRVCLHLAAGHLVLSEPLSPTHGLEAGLDYLDVTQPGHLEHALGELARWPGLWHAVRVRGRRKAEGFRASRVYPRLLADLRADVAAFGTARGR